MRRAGAGRAGKDKAVVLRLRHGLPHGDRGIVRVAAAHKRHEGIEYLRFHARRLRPRELRADVLDIVKHKGQFVRVCGQQPALIARFVRKEKIVDRRAGTLL